HVRWGCLARPRRDVVDEDAAFPVEDQAARSGDGRLRRAIRLGPRGIDLATIDLQIGEAGAEHAEDQHHHDPEGQESDRATVALPVRGEQLLVHQATRSTSRRRAAIATASGPTAAARTMSYTVDGRIVPAAAADSGAVVRAVVVRRISIE